MKTAFFCTRWGSEESSWKDFFARAQGEGYSGIEYGIAAATPAAELEEVFSLAARRGMSVIAQHYDTYEADFTKHADLYSAWLDKMSAYKPLFINSQTGKDFFSFEQNHALVQRAEKFTEETGVRIYHETHRNKFTFAAHTTYAYLQQIPSLQLTLDISHWVCVAESYLEDQLDAVHLAIERTHHLHARVGYPEGPQVPDPRVREWETALNAHLLWWDKVAERVKRQGADAVLTITPEFGPYPYMVPLPFTRQPITNQWEVNVFMMHLLQERFRKYESISRH
ncbi:MAG: sugar phosphate isomerase/epimerase [Bacteroidota bacterium]